MKMTWLIFLFPMASFGLDRLSALSMLETGDSDLAVGRAGEISRYQIMKTEWRSVTTSTNYRDPSTAKQVVARLMEDRVEKFRLARHRAPTDFEFYALWNAPAQALTGRISRTVAERSRRFVNLCGSHPSPLAKAEKRLSSSAQVFN